MLGRDRCGHNWGFPERYVRNWASPVAPASTSVELVKAPRGLDVGQPNSVSTAASVSQPIAGIDVLSSPVR
jgi:hypothetical protein